MMPEVGIHHDRLVWVLTFLGLQGHGGTDSTHVVGWGADHRPSGAILQTLITHASRLARMHRSHTHVVVEAHHPV